MNEQRTIPASTYRVQLNHTFTFDDASAIVDYLSRLGISHLYTSPFLRARPGSMHGYDIVDHTRFNPEIGSAEDFERLADHLHTRDMGLVLDFVPNHMGVGGSENPWWNDVLEWGESSPYARFFDIDWDPMRRELHGKVLLPFLGERYGAILESGQLELRLDEDGSFAVWYYIHRFPLHPSAYAPILERAAAIAGHDEAPRLRAMAAAFHAVAVRPKGRPAIEEARERASALKGQLAEAAREPAIASALDAARATYNGDPEHPESFRDLYHLLSQQAYRPALWRVAFDEINYRRFFDVNELAGLRMEDSECFAITHELVFDLLARRRIDGLRIDHVDGLYDPAGYCRLLRSRSQALDNPLYLVVEKITAYHEELRADWEVDGTTGYEFVNLVNGLFVDASNERRFNALYRRFSDDQLAFDEILYRCKQRIIRVELASEMAVLAGALDRIAHANLDSADYTLHALREALTEVVAAFPVYRTYVSGGELSPEDRRYIEWSVAQARKRSALPDGSIFDFIERVLTTDIVRDEEASRYPRMAVLRFAMKFQQYTSPVMAKSLEDTAFYRYLRLASLNEVGGDPRRFGSSVAAFHRATQLRAKRSPHAMLATATHDTKRGEDVRARIDVLSEIPAEWRTALGRWQRYNARKRSEIDGAVAPHPADEYLFYQTLAGAWPMSLMDPEHLDPHALGALAERITAYMTKALREGKVRSSWTAPNAAYEEAVSSFVARTLDGAAKSLFLPDFARFAHRVAYVGAYNGLAQIVLKVMSPGVPDTYQGTELWDLTLVDPDNRRPVDYAQRSALLAQCEMRTDLGAYAAELLDRWQDGRIKLYTLWRALRYRNAHPDDFIAGPYEPLAASGRDADRVCAFARQEVVVIVPRLVAPLLLERDEIRTAPEWSADTEIALPERMRGVPLRHLFTGAPVPAGATVAVAGVLGPFPVAVLVPAELA